MRMLSWDKQVVAMNDEVIIQGEVFTGLPANYKE